MDEESRIVRARTRLLLKRPFWGHLSVHLELWERPNLYSNGRPTVATDGVYLYYNPEAVKGWTDKELQGVVCHQVAHCALGHLWRRGYREHKKWNIATDYAANNLLVKDGLVLHQGALVGRYMEMAAETIYAQLPDQLGGETLDNHDVWEERGEEREREYLPNYLEQDREAKAEATEPEVYRVKGISVEAPKAVTPTEPEQAEPRETTYNEELEAEPKLAEQAEPQGASSEQVWKQRVAQAATQARMQGKLPGHLATLVEEVLYPTVDWRDLLRDFVQIAAKNDYRLMPPNKRYLWWPMYLPSLKGEHLEIAVAIDTSGSIWDELLAKFYSEVRGIALEYESWVIHLFLCDAQMHDYRAISSEDEDWPREMKGRGGTSFVPVFEAIEGKELRPSCLVYLTDLAGTFPQAAPDYPVIWLTTRPEADVPFGDKIHVEETRE